MEGASYERRSRLAAGPVYGVLILPLDPLGTRLGCRPGRLPHARLEIVLTVSDRLLTASEVAERLSVPKSWILESARSGAMPCVRLGRYVRFDLADVERWLEECKRPGRPIALRSRP